MLHLPNRTTGIDEAELALALDNANLPALVAVLYQLTGDERWLCDPYRPSRRFGMDPNDSGGFDEAVQAEIRREAYAAVVAWARGEEPAVAVPAGDLLVRMMRWVVSEEVPPEYAPMIGSQLFGDDEPAGPRTDPSGFSVVVIGAGLGGLTAAIKLKQSGIPFVVLERSDHAGGVWWQNHYPGAGVDTPSYLYSFSFFPRNWTSYFAKRDELVAYVDELVEHYDLLPHIRFGVEVEGATYDEERQRWHVHTREAGDARVRDADAVISAVGIFSQPKVPDLRGAESFEGPVFHSARWPEGLSAEGRNVAIVGTGASAMQILPAVVDQAASVTVYQRSPAWVTPVDNYFHAVPDHVHWLMEHVPFYYVWYRFSLAWTFNDKLHPTIQVDPEWIDPDHSVNATNDRHRRLFTAYIQGELEGRPDLVEKCLPDDPPWGKRMLIDNGWYAALRRPHVELVAESVEALTPHGVVAASGEERPAELVVLSTGFEATRFLHPMRVVGRDGQVLSEVWNDDDARAYLGITTPGFPNLFFVYGPNTNGSGGSFLAWAESQVGYIVQLIGAMVDKDLGALEPRQDVHDEYNRRVDEAHSRMIWTHPRLRTYYRNSRGRVVVNIPWRVVDYWTMLRTVDLDDYVVEPAAGAQERNG